MKSLIPVFCCFLFYSCEKTEIVNQQVLFQIEYSNAAWGIQHKIWLVDSSAVLSVYNLPPKWNHPDQNGYLSLDEMNENISQVETFGCNIDKSDLQKYSSMIGEAKKGQLTGPERRMYDAGTSVFSGFIFDRKRERYQQVILLQEGDIYSENLSEAAKEIYTWLKTLCIQL
jgi:hypothetical protein